MNSLAKMQVLGKSGTWELGILVIGLVYLEHDGKLSTYDSPYDAMRRITEEKDRQLISKQLKGDKNK